MKGGDGSAEDLKGASEVTVMLCFLIWTWVHCVGSLEHNFSYLMHVLLIFYNLNIIYLNGVGNHAKPEIWGENTLLFDPPICF